MVVIEKPLHVRDTNLYTGYMSENIYFSLCLYNQCTTKGLVGFLMNGAKLAGWLTMICTLTHVTLSWPLKGFPGSTSGKEPTCQCRRCKRHGLDTWISKIPWRRAWQPRFLYSCLENPVDRGGW